MSLNILLITDELIKDRTQVHGNIDPELIHPDIRVAQDMYLHPLLGSALYNKISDDFNSATGLTGNYATLYNLYIVDTLMWYVLAELATSLSYQFWNKGIVRKQGSDTELPSYDELMAVQNKYKQRAEFYANRLRLYLKENAATMFPEYLNPGSGVDAIYPDNKTFSMPVYLGDESDCGKSYEEIYQGNKPSC